MIQQLLTKSESTYCPNKCPPEAAFSWKLTNHGISLCVILTTTSLSLKTSLSTDQLGAKKFMTCPGIWKWNVQIVMLHGTEIITVKSVNLADVYQLSCFSEQNVMMSPSVYVVSIRRLNTRLHGWRSHNNLLGNMLLPEWIWKYLSKWHQKTPNYHARIILLRIYGGSRMQHNAFILTQSL